MLEVAFVLHPGAHRNRSMQLYAERLQGFAPPDQRWRIAALPGVDGRIGQRLSELAVPPATVPWLRADVIHIVDHAHAGYLRFWRGPSVVTVHDLIPLRAMAGEYPVRGGVSKLAGRWFRWNASALQLASALVCPSHASASVLQRLLGLDAAVVPNGVEEAFFLAPDAATTARVDARLPADARVMLQVSSGFIYKNDPAFLAVFEKLAATRPELVAVRVGSPLPADMRQHLRRRGLSARYIEYGPANQAELRALYRLAALLLFPSWDEGFGWPPLEAMAGGCPVVASDRGALAETVGPHGLIADPADVDALAAQVAAVLDDPASLTTRVRAATEFARGFTWQGAAELLAATYRRVAR